MRVNFSVTNQLATPSIHAAALANRPPAGQPGRLFVDTDNPSSGIYRDTGTVWENITGGASAGNLQTVTDAGNTTDNNILLTYADNTIANALVFYNDALTQEEYLIEKRGTGITTNDSLAIQSRGNISPSTNPVGFLIDGPNDVIKSFYTTSYSEVGLKLDFANQNYRFGNGITNIGYLEIDSISGIVSICGNISEPLFGIDFLNAVVNVGDYLSWNSGTHLIVDDGNQLIKTKNSGNDYGIKLDFANRNYSLGDYNFIYDGAYLFIDDANQLIKTSTGANAHGIKLDFANNILEFRYVADGQGLFVDVNNFSCKLGDYLFNLGNGTTLIVNDGNGLINTSYQGNNAGVKLDFINATYYFGDFDNIVGSGTAFVINDNTQVVSTQLSQNDRGMIVDFQNQVFKLGYDFTNDFFGIDSANDKLIASTNRLVGSSGASSGQHLKIKVGTTDYVIELKNP